MVAEAVNIAHSFLDHFKFKVPESYIQLHNNGRLRAGETRADWVENWHQIILSRPPALIQTKWHQSVEWWGFEEIREWEQPDYWKESNHLIPFAGNGYGDLWAWDLSRETEKGVPVVFCLHDENQSEIYAGNFNDFLFRSLLEGFSQIDLDTYYGQTFNEDESKLRKYCKLNVACVTLYLNEEKGRILDSIASDNPLILDQANDYAYLVSAADVERILNTQIFSDQVGTLFQHMIPHEDEVDEAAFAKVRERLEEQRRRDQFSRATLIANNLFREKEYERFIGTLDPFRDLLTPSQRSKLKYCERQV